MMLEINGLVKKYKDFTLNCSMKVEQGCITGLVGENGAGKSTTFKAALGEDAGVKYTYPSGDKRRKAGGSYYYWRYRKNVHGSV